MQISGFPFNRFHLFIINLFLIIFVIFPSIASSQSICKKFLCRIGGKYLSPGDELYLSKYDIILCNRFHYNNIGLNTWYTLKSINPGIEIYLYIIPTFVDPTHDVLPTISINDIGRYENDRNHSMGNLNRDNAGLFLLDTNGKRIHPNDNPNSYFLDFGSPKFHKYVTEAIITDLVYQPWRADGVYADVALPTPYPPVTTSIPIAYTTTDEWVAGMNSLLNQITLALQREGQKFASNRGSTRYAEGVEAWLALDQSDYPPTAVLEEGAFAVAWGSGDVQFYPETDWKRQVELLGKIHRSKVLYMSHCNLANKDDIGTDNYGKSFTFWDVLWYSLGSFLLGRNDVDDNSYFLMMYGENTSAVNYYYDEYDKIDLGLARGDFVVNTIKGINIYSREFEKGYVYVNPSEKDVYNIKLPMPCKQITHGNLNKNKSFILTVNYISLKSHRAAILYKASN